MDAAGVLNSLHHIPFKHMEIEFRAGTFRKKQFIPGVSPPLYDAIHTKLQKGMTFTTEHITETIHGDYRVRQGGGALRKVKLFSQDFPDQGSRLSVASEAEVPLIDHFTRYSNGHTFKRQKDRTTFQVPGGIWKIDMTKVLSLKDKDEDRYTYEIEVELADHAMLLIVPIQVLLEEGMQILDRLIRHPNDV